MYSLGMWLNLEALLFSSSGFQDTTTNMTHSDRQLRSRYCIYDHYIDAPASNVAAYIWNAYSRCGYIWSCNRVFRWRTGLIEAYQTCFSRESKQLSPPLRLHLFVRHMNVCLCSCEPVCNDIWRVLTTLRRHKLEILQINFKPIRDMRLWKG